MDLKAATKPVSSESLTRNATELANIRYIVAMAAGCAAGALRLESMYGFGFNVVTNIATTLLLLFITRSPSYYFTKPTKALMLDGVMPSLAVYVLAWCLVYSLVET